MEGFAIWAVHSTRVFTSLTKPIFFLCQWMGFCMITHLDDIIVMICSKHAGKRHNLFMLLTGLSWATH